MYHAHQPPSYPVIAVVAAALAALALWRFLVRLRRDRLVADTPQAHIRSAAQGYVKVTGRTQPAGPAPTAAPLSARPCVWWSYEIAHEERDAKGNRRWETIDRGSSVEPFTLVDDDDAGCLVGPVQAEITPTVRNVWYGSTSRPSGPPPESSSLLHVGSWRYTERLLGVGARVCVMGELRSHSEIGDVNAAIAAEAARVEAGPAGAARAVRCRSRRQAERCRMGSGAPGGGQRMADADAAVGDHAREHHLRADQRRAVPDRAAERGRARAAREALRRAVPRARAHRCERVRLGDPAAAARANADDLQVRAARAQQVGLPLQHRGEQRPQLIELLLGERLQIRRGLIPGPALPIAAPCRSASCTPAGPTPISSSSVRSSSVGAGSAAPLTKHQPRRYSGNSRWRAPPACAESLRPGPSTMRALHVLARPRAVRTAPRTPSAGPSRARRRESRSRARGATRRSPATERQRRAAELRQTVLHGREQHRTHRPAHRVGLEEAVLRSAARRESASLPRRAD